MKDLLSLNKKQWILSTVSLGGLPGLLPVDVFPADIPIRRSIVARSAFVTRFLVVNVSCLKTECSRVHIYSTKFWSTKKTTGLILVGELCS